MCRLDEAGHKKAEPSRARCNNTHTSRPGTCQDPTEAVDYMVRSILFARAVLVNSTLISTTTYKCKVNLRLLW
jgi:hypothetical protein